MGNTGLEPELLASLIESSTEILETMVFMTPDSIERGDDEASHPTAYTSQVVGTLGFTGTRSGQVIVCCTSDLCLTIAAKMLMTEPEELGDLAEAADAFGEVVNMIAGSFKNTWVAMGNEMNLAVPVVTQNGSVLVNEKQGELNCRIVITLDGEPLDVTVLFAGQN